MLSCSALAHLTYTRTCHTRLHTLKTTFSTDPKILPKLKILTNLLIHLFCTLPFSMHLYLALISCLVCTAHCWQFDGGGAAAVGQRLHRSARNTARALARGPPPARGSAALLGSQQQDVLYACPLNSMCQCAGLPNETSTLIEINCNEVALYKFPGKSRVYVYREREREINACMCMCELKLFSCCQYVLDQQLRPHSTCLAFIYVANIFVANSGDNETCH